MALAMLFAGATTASAHAYLIASDPGSGAILDTAPRQALLQFNTPVTVRLSSASLVDASGRPVPGVSVRPAPGNQSVIVVDLPALPKGAYRLTYVTWDSIDLHKTGGSIDFGIGQAAAFAAADPSTAARPSSLETGTRWLELGGIALLIGVAVVWLAVLPALRGRVPDDALQPVWGAARRRLPPLAMAGYLAVVAGKIGQLGVALAALTVDGATSVSQAFGAVLLGSRFGELWLLGMALAIVVVVAARAAIARTGRPWQGAALAAAALALVVVYAQSSHGSNQSGFDLAQIAFRIVHLAAAGVWVGGLTALAVVLLGRLRDGPVALAAVRVYGGLAVLAVGLLTASGLVLAGAAVASPEALITTTYGWTLIAKVLAVAVVMVIGLRHSRLAGLPPARSLAFEVGGMLIVFWGAAALGATAPSPPRATPAPAAAVSAPLLGTDTTKLIGDLTVRTSMAPGHTGGNTLFIQLHGDASVPFRPVTDVRVTLTQRGEPAQNLSGTFIGRGRWQFPQVTIADPGQLAVAVAVIRSPGPDANVSFSWPITPAPPQYVPLSLPTGAWASVLDVLAGAIGLLVAAWLVAGAIRARRPGRALPATT